jgi:hypothetical protein
MVPRIASTDKSVCATWKLPVWHRHSCLCFGKVQRLPLSKRFDEQTSFALAREGALDKCSPALGPGLSALECAWQSHRFGREGGGNDRAGVASITRCVSSRFHRPPKAVALPPHSKVLRTKVAGRS